jgi:hypothetical protein
MARVLIATQAWGWVVDQAGNPLAGQTVTIRKTDGSAATHYSAITGGTSSTSVLTTAANGTIPRYIDEDTYDVTISGVTRRVEAAAGATVRVLSEAPINVDDVEYAGDLQAAVTAAGAAAGGNGGRVYVPAGVRPRSSAVSVPNFVEILGDGQGTIIRCTGNHFAFALSPGNRSAIRNLAIDAQSQQTSGGAISFAAAGANIRLQDLYLGSNLYYGLDINPASTTGIYWINGVRWNGVIGCNTAIRVGGGTGLVTDVYFSQCVGTASTAGSMQTWVAIPSNADTIGFTDSLFITGQTGMQIGTTGQITNMRLARTTVDSLVGVGLNLVSTRSFQMLGGEASTCGAANDAQIVVGASALHTVLQGVTVQNGGGDGIDIIAGSKGTKIVGCSISDNNTTNTALRFGIGVAAGASDFIIAANTITNGTGWGFGTGHQKYGVQVASGASDHYAIVNNLLRGNETSNLVVDNGSGSNKTITGNVS